MEESSKGGGFLGEPSSKADGETSYSTKAASGLHMLCPMLRAAGVPEEEAFALFGPHWGKETDAGIGPLLHGVRAWAR